MTFAWLTQSEGQGQGQHLLLSNLHLDPGAAAGPGSTEMPMEQDSDKGSITQEALLAVSKPASTCTSGAGCVLTHILPWNPGEHSANSLLSFCIYSTDHRVYVHDPVQEPLRVFLPLLTSLSQSMALNPVFVLEAEPLENPQATALPKVAQAKCKSLLTDYFSVYFQLASQKPGNPPANLSYT